MKLHLVGGFLGSGKTTAIIQSARWLMARGLRVGVVTNDQGKYLVDTAFVRLADIPAVEVTGGCFCCSYDDLNARLAELIEAAAPQVIFAESVGSCADIVATVVKPLLELDEGKYRPASFSVLADARLLLRRLQGDEMPFSDDVVYIFDRQIEEAGLLVANKADLLSFEGLRALERLIQEKHPGLPFILQSSLTTEGILAWANLIQSGEAALARRSLDLDYRRYAQGEAALAWVDRRIHLRCPDGAAKAVIAGGLRRLAQSLAQRGAGIGHVKLMARGSGLEVKISLPTLEEPGWSDRIPEFPASEVELLVNARVEMPAEALNGLLLACFSMPGVTVQPGEGEAFHPKEPRPAHRF